MIYIAVLAVGQGGLSSVLDYKDIKADPFDGMTYPIRYVPNWLKSGVWTPKTQYSEIDARDFVEIPKYDSKLLAVTDPDNERALFERYTYFTPYMGAYLDDARKEYAGSHLAVDIRAPVGTPVRSVANGVVVRTKDDASGDGKYIVIRHNGVPYNGQSLEMYSSYLHLDSLTIQVGQKVHKGDVIGKVGMTGITTTPHLHFQMDRANAPFYPYWPFTFAEARKAGYDMFSAVNAGVGAQGALAYTYSPFDVIHQNLDYVPSGNTSVVVASPVPSVATEKPTPSTATSKPVAIEQPASTVNVALLTAAATSSFASAPTPVEKPVVAQSVALVAVKEPAPVPDVRDIPSNTVLAPTPAPEAVVPTKTTSSSLVVSVADQVFASAPAQAPVEALSVTQSFASPGSVHIEIRSLDISHRSTSAPVFGGVKISLTQEGRIVASAMVNQTDFKKGVATVIVVFGKQVPDAVRADADGIIASSVLTGLSPSVVAEKTVVSVTAASSKKALFKDVPTTSIYAPAVEALVAQGIVKGTSKSYFSPAKSVTRAEALVIVMRALNVPVDMKARVKMSDVSANHWVQPYLAKAVQLGAVAPGRKSFGPNVATTRAEVAALLFVLGHVPTTELSIQSVTDISPKAWYAPYAKSAVQFEIMKAFSGKFRPDTAMRRGDMVVAVWNFMKKFSSTTLS